MGAGASLGTQTKSIAKDMLNAIFANTDIMQLLELSNRSSCSKFAFDYKESLLKHLKTVQLYPAKGEKGKIALLSIADIAPTKATTPDMAKLVQRRDEFCIDAGYIYVRIFQIYAALALTMLDDNPARTISQVGGGLTKTVFGTGLAGEKKYAMAANSMLAPFIVMNNKYVKGVYTSGRDERLIMTILMEGGDTSLVFNALPVINETNDITVEGYYSVGNQELPTNISFHRDIVDGKQNITFSVQDTEIAAFTQKTGGWIYSLMVPTPEPTSYKPLDSTTSLSSLVKKISELFQSGETKQPGVVSTTTTASGSSVYVGFEKTRKILQEVQAGKADYPISYAIGRALTLLYPISPQDIRTSKQVITHLCKKTLDFEKNGSYLPKADTKISDNVYFASLIGLYYDTYVIKGSSVEFTKSRGGDEALKEASRDLASLYKVTTTPETFLEKGAFRKLEAACKGTGNMVVSPQLAAVIRKNTVDKLLAFQANHVKKAEAIISKLFKIQITALPNNKKTVSIDFSPSLTEVNGRAELDKICVEARKLLLNYYMTVEAYFILGVDIIEKNMGAVMPV